MSRKRNFKDPRTPLVLLTAGKDEELFFKQMQRDCRFSNMKVFGKSEKTSTLVDLIVEAGRLRLEHGLGRAWCIFNPNDIELSPTILTESRKMAKQKRVALAYTNPGIEFWFYLHYTAPETPFQDREDAIEALQRFLPDYHNGETFLKGKGSDLYMQLFTNKAQAIINANRFNMLFGDRAGLTGARLDFSCTIPKFLKDVGDICGKCYISKGQNAAELQKY